MTASNHMRLPELFVSADAAEKLSDEGAKLPRWHLTAGQLCDLDLLMNGGFFPLKGFMARTECELVLREGRLPSGMPWPVEVALAVDAEFGNRVEPGNDIGLWEREKLLAIMSVTDHWTSDSALYLGGKVKGLRPPLNAGPTPNQTRNEIRARGWVDVRAVFERRAALTAPGDVLRLSPGADQDLVIPATIVNDRSVVVPICLCSRFEGATKAQLLQIVARNFGATSVQTSEIGESL